MNLWRLEPGRSVGPVEIGMTPDSVRGHLGAPDATRSRSVEMEFWHYPSLIVTFLDENVNMVICEEGFPARTDQGAYVGMAWRMLALLGELEFDEELGLWFEPGKLGLYYEVMRPARPEEQPWEPTGVVELYEVTDPVNAIVARIYVI